jgi:hypothetical protein
MQAGALVLGFLAVWVGAATAHRTTGWRTLLFPVVFILVVLVVYTALGILLAGAGFTFQALFADFGIQPQ